MLNDCYAHEILLKKLKIVTYGTVEYGTVPVNKIIKLFLSKICQTNISKNGLSNLRVFREKIMKRTAKHMSAAFWKQSGHIRVAILYYPTRYFIDQSDCLNTNRKIVPYRYVIEHIPQIVYLSTINPHKSYVSIEVRMRYEISVFLARACRILTPVPWSKKIPLCRFAASIFAYSKYLF